MKLTSRKRFERWAKRKKFPIFRDQEVTRDGTRWAGYSNRTTQVAWLAWTARGRVKGDGE
jgi:hypothetical protein